MRPTAQSAIAAICALAAFTIAVLAGFFAGVSADRVLVRALMALMICYPIGLIVACAANRVLLDRLEREESADSARSSLHVSGSSHAEPGGDHPDEGEEVLVV